MLTLLDAPGLESRTSSADVAKDAGYRQLVAGEFLFREGDQRSHVYRVEKGAICLFKERLDGSRDVIEFAFPGDLVGLGYLDNHVANAQATMETALSCLPRSALEPALDKSPGSKSRLSAAIEREVAFLKEAQAQTGQSKALERIAALLVTLARCNAYEGRDPAIIADSLSCGVVAGYLNMSIDELAGALKELESRDLVEASTKGLRLKHLDVLEHLADAGGRNVIGAL